MRSFASADKFLLEPAECLAVAQVRQVGKAPGEMAGGFAVDIAAVTCCRARDTMGNRRTEDVPGDYCSLGSSKKCADVMSRRWLVPSLFWHLPPDCRPTIASTSPATFGRFFRMPAFNVMVPIRPNARPT